MAMLANRYVNLSHCRWLLAKQCRVIVELVASDTRVTHVVGKCKSSAVFMKTCTGRIKVLLSLSLTLQVYLAEVFVEDTCIGPWAVKEPRAQDGTAGAEAAALSTIHGVHNGSASCVVSLGGVVAQPLQEMGKRMYTGRVHALLLQPLHCSLDEWLRQPSRHMTRLQLWKMLSQLLEGLHAGELAGVAHRDVKPANILMDAGHNLFLADYGVASCDVTATTTSSIAKGTPRFMAPEVELCRAASETSGDAAPPYNLRRADVYSFGVTVLHLALPQLWAACELRISRARTPWARLRSHLLAAVQMTADPGIADMVVAAMQTDAACRPTVAELAAMAADGLAKARAQEVATAEASAGSRMGVEPTCSNGSKPSLAATRPLEGDVRAWQADEWLASQLRQAAPQMYRCRSTGRRGDVLSLLVRLPPHACYPCTCSVGVLMQRTSQTNKA